MCDCACKCSPRRRLQVGDTIYGFCGGLFGSSSYGPRLVVHIDRDWMVYRNEYGTYSIYNGDTDELVEFTQPEPYEEY